MSIINLEGYCVPLTDIMDDETDIFVPNWEYWDSFIRKTNLIFEHGKMQGHYEQAVVNYGESIGIKVLNLSPSLIYNDREGFILRFKSKHAKLAFMLKWS